MPPATPSCSYADGKIFMVDFQKSMQVRLFGIETATGKVDNEWWVPPQDFPDGFDVGIPEHPTTFQFYKFHSHQFIAECSST